MSAVDDITLQSARRGDRDAQTRLLGAMQDHWFRFCASQLRDSHRAEDATQETAIRVLQSLAKFDGRSSFKTWTFGIALNVCRESRRKSQRNGGIDLSMAAEPAMPDDPRGDAMEAGEELATLHALLATLPDRQREVVALRYFEAMSVEETAAAMACAEGTVKATLFAALRALRNKFTAEQNRDDATPKGNDRDR
jgi:RNA polymerase sigma-70 factor (ECF subfamily)